MELRVLSAGAMQPGLIAVAPEFRRQSGHELKVTYAIASELRRRIGGGEIADVVLAPVAAIAELENGGRVAAEGQVAVGRVGAGVVARNGAPMPGVGSAEALKRSLLDADSVVYNRASSGVYIETMLKKIGIYERIRDKLIRYDDGTAVMHHLMRGKGREFGFGGITDILMYRDQGLRLVGPLPEEIQNYTAYTAALITASPHPDAAQALLQFLASPPGKALFSINGIN
ncbi:MAG TPA: substrate-binding domain-containing protein [Burkholderiales bacterium]|nr:substrate-binding domain-containing protein [Burkholderiales bacterium]